MRAEIQVTARLPMDGKGQSVAARFIGDPEIGAGPAPFRSVRRDAAAAGAKLREEMRQLVAQGAVDLAPRHAAQSRQLSRTREARYSARPAAVRRRPDHSTTTRAASVSGALLEKKLARELLERRIAPGRTRRERRSEG